LKFLANENFPLTSFNYLQNQGWDIEHIGSTNGGVRDEEVVSISIQENRIIITFDRDYGELVFNKGYKPLGVIYIRLQNFKPDFPGKLLVDLSSNDELIFENYFTVVDEIQVRQRKI